MTPRLACLARAGSAASASLLALAALAPAAPAATAPAPGVRDTHHPVGALRITLHDGTRLSDPVLARARLNCYPTRGSTHPHAARACLTLARAGGDLAALPKQNRPCAMRHRPVTVVTEGTWNGRAAGYAHTYPNQCVANAHSADVFALAPRR